MFYFDIKEFESPVWENIVSGKSLQIEENLQCFILLESKNGKIVPPLLNKIVDYLLDTIHPKDVYNTFWVILENINFFIKSLGEKKWGDLDLSIIIGILDKQDFHFSKIGDASCFFLNQKGEVQEISEKSWWKHTFDYISSGKLKFGETILLFTENIDEYFTQSDWGEIAAIHDISQMTKNISDIFREEKGEKNIGIIGLKTDFLTGENEMKQKIQSLKYVWYKLFDNNISKKFIAFSLYLKEKIEARGKIVKNILFFSGILLSTIILFNIISSILGKSIEGSKNTQYKNDLIQSREFIRIANQNLANKEAFELNIKKAEELLDEVSKQGLFLNDIQSIQDDIAVVKKQFNGIEVFEWSTSNLIFKGMFDDAIKMVELSKKLYVIGKSSVYGPIVSGQEMKNNVFKDIDIDDVFLDGVSVGDDIILTTQKGRVVKFSKDGTFKYINVVGQTTWQGSPFVESYNNNIYMTNASQSQIFKHAPSSGSYTSWVPYLNDADSKNIGKIVSIGIDGGIYILNQQGKLYKFFSAPKYRLESIVLNNLPQNYTIGNEIPHLIVRNNLNYVYMVLNNKIWVFEPNSKVYSDTKYLTYRGQIEGKSEKILGVNVPSDGELEILTKSWVYKVSFDISGEKILLR